jgi:hypothetical protein
MGLILLLAIALVGAGLAAPAQAAPPGVKVVPWVASNSLVPHDTYPGKAVKLKGTSSVQGANIAWTWDYGDGTPVATGTVSDMYVVEATHTYAGTIGTVFTARLTIQNTTTGESASKPYYVKLQTKSLSVEVNVAIDEGLWELHKEQYRYHYVDPTSHKESELGAWDRSRFGGAAFSGYYTIWAANVNAFEVNGHLENGDPDNPYVETVARGMRQLFYCLTGSAIPASITNPKGTFSPDGNGNTKAIYVNQSYPFYQGGFFVDAIVSSGTPNAVVQAGPAALDGMTYVNVVQDLVDGYVNCQYRNSPQGGGWRYSCGEAPDNSPSQWAAISIIPALREWGTEHTPPGPVNISPLVKEWNKVWLQYSYDGHGFGYTSAGYYPWGPYAVTPSGMVQMVMDGVGRGNPMWDNVETWMRNNFGNSGGATVAVKDYYYGLFSFVKSLLLHPCPTPAACSRDASDTTPYGIKMLHSATAGVPDIDWYGAETSKGAPTDGIARTLVNDQNTTWGYWYGHNNDGNQYRFETASAIIMLNRTVFAGGAPVAVAVATPNPAVAGAIVTLDGTGSFHQDVAKTIVQWDWDIDGDGIFELHGPIVTHTWAALGTYPVTLQVTDNAGTPATASSILTVIVSIPPLAPTANAGGPYNLCPGAKPWFLDGSKSVNPDEGKSEPGQPADTIYANPNQFTWNLGTAFGDAIGIKPDVTAWFTAKGPGNYLVQLKVTDTTATAYPSSGQPNLSSTASGYVYVKSATDPACVACITNLKASAKSKLVQLTWTLTGADHYNVYRSTVNGGPYSKIAVAIATQTVFFDATVVNGTTYYYVVRPTTLGETELCQSNQVSALPRALR